MQQESPFIALLKKLGFGVGYEIPEEEDLSGLGANLEVFSPQEASLEMEDPDFTTHMEPQGFLPVGNCMVRTGDLYCVNLKDAKKRGLYRFTRENGAIVPVLENIATISRYKGK